MSSQATPSVLINPGSSTPTPPEDHHVSGEPPDKPGPHTGDYFGSSTLPKPLHHNLLKTYSVSEAQSSQDSNYFSPQTSSRNSRMTTFRPTNNASPSEHLATPSCISPGLSLNGSYQSSDYGLSLCSHSSSEYLSPPEFQVDCDNPPYKPDRDDAESLTMINLRRAQKILAGKPLRGRRQRKKRRRCRHKRVKVFEHQDRSYWWLPGCQVAPTAPSGHRDLCVGHTGSHVPRNTSRGNTDTFGRLHPVVKSFPAIPIVSRRWSSVEVGSHQVPLETKPTSKRHRRNIVRSTAINDVLAPIDLGRRFRSSTSTPGAIEHDIIRSVRERLTLREIRPSLLDVPTSITLRRASDESEESSVGDVKTPPTSSGKQAWEIHEAQKSKSLHHRRASATYLITSRDIDSITELIEAKFSRSLEASPKSKRSPSEVHVSSSRGSRSSTVGKTVGVTSRSLLSEAASDIADRTRAKLPQCPLERLQVLQDHKRKRRGHAKILSAKTDHEVIWQDNTTTSPNSGSSSGGEDESKPSPSFVCSEPGTPGHHYEHDSCVTPPTRPQFVGKRNTLESHNVSSLVGEWQSNITLVAASSDDEVKKKNKKSSSTEVGSGVSTASPGSPTRPKVRPFLRYRASANQVQDVESFPPLPRRKATADWFSPLPEMEIYPPSMTPISARETGSLSKELTPKASQMSWVRSSQLSPSKNVEFNWNVDYLAKTPEIPPTTEIRHTSIDAQLEGFRRKSTVKAHPCSLARTGSPSSMGSSIGVSHHERRRCPKPRPAPPPHAKSMPPKTSPSNSSPKTFIGATVDPIKRVRTIDNIDKGAHRDTCARWRPPSVCPSPRTPSPSEECDDALEDKSEDSGPSSILMTARTSHLERIRSVFGERMNSIKDISPPSVKLDPIGIYGQLTGTQRRTHNRKSGQDWEREGSHECDNAANHPDRNPSVDWIG